MFAKLLAYVRRRFVVLLFLLFGSAGVLAQVPSPTAKPSEKTADDVVVINTAHIQIDVTVTDKKGRTVKGLQAGDFELYENDEKQTIRSFAFYDQPGKTENLKNGASRAGNPPAPVRNATVDKQGAAIAVVVDDLNLSMESVNLIKRSLRKFVEEGKFDGQFVAVLRTGGGSDSLRPFTTDRRELLDSIDKIRWRASGTGSVTTFPPIEPTFADMMKSQDPSMSEASYQAALGREREKDNLRNAFFANISLMALNFMINNMRDLPGRKSIMLFSEGFAQVQFDRNKFPEVADTVDNAVRLLIDTANRHSIVIHTMDARGPASLDLGPIDNTGSQTRARVRQRVEERNFRLVETQGTLREIATETGGIALSNTGDVGAGLNKMLDDQQGYYLIGYEPDGDTFDPKTRRFNRLTVRVRNPDYQVRFRSGFFNVPTSTAGGQPSKRATWLQQLSGAVLLPQELRDIRLRLNAVFVRNPDTSDSVRAFVYVEGADIGVYQNADGSMRGDVSLMAVAYDEGGKSVHEIVKTQNLTFPKTSLEHVLKKGIAIEMAFPISVPGGYEIRIALLDHKSGKIGSVKQAVSIPRLADGNLGLSGAVLDNLSVGEWKRESNGEAVARDPVRSTALRRFARNSVLTYGLEVYNAKRDSGKRANLQMQIRILQGGKAVYEGKPQPLTSEDNRDTDAIPASGAILIPDQFGAGAYLLEITVRDVLGQQSVTQSVLLEII